MGIIFLVPMMMVPFPLNLIFITVDLIFISIGVSSFFFKKNNIYAEIGDDGSLKINAAQGVKSEPEKNVLEIYGSMAGIKAKINISKDNIKKVEMANSEDLQKMNKYTAQENLFSNNPTKSFSASKNLIKYSFKQLEIEPGLGLFSFIFSLNQSGVKITLNSLRVKDFFHNEEIKNPVIFFSAKNPQEFINEFKN